MPQHARTRHAANPPALIGWSRTFPGAIDQVPEARRFLADILGNSPLTGDAVLCLSELVTNAVLHSQSGGPGGTVTVRVQRFHDGGIRIEVQDQGGIWTLRPAGDEQRGHGLLIVSELSRACGIMGDQRGRTLWFELHRPS